MYKKSAVFLASRQDFTLYSNYLFTGQRLARSRLGVMMSENFCTKLQKLLVTDLNATSLKLQKNVI